MDWVSDSPIQSITLPGGGDEGIGTGQTLCPDCAQVGEDLNVCGLGPESLRELFDTLRMIRISEVKAKMEALRGLGVQMNMQARALGAARICHLRSWRWRTVANWKSPLWWFGPNKRVSRIPCRFNMRYRIRGAVFSLPRLFVRASSQRCRLAARTTVPDRSALRCRLP